MNDPRPPSAQTLLSEVFGFDAFRPGQEAVVEALLAGRSCLSVFPTGGGKSLCYQLPALMLDGLTLVVSPLIALMKDQVDALQRRGVAAARLDGTLSREEARQVEADAFAGKLRLLYVAPERLANERFLRRLAGTRIALLAVDEAHCISEWGHNFRPDYLKIARFAAGHGVGRVLALTATATPAVSEDIRRAFGIAAEDHVQTGFHRPNLELHVTPCRGDEKREALLDRLRASQGSAVVYVTLQRTAEEVAEFLDATGVPAQAYHAGLKPERRDVVQDAFMSGGCRVVVATIAFGMGIDKADIRAVYHYDLPKTLENYVQEVGRAGRDGLPARCELLACADDRTVLEGFTYGDTPTRESLASLVDELLGGPERFAVSHYELSVAHDMRQLVVATALTYLELQGMLEPTGPFYAGYKLRLLRPRAEVLGRFDPERAGFLASVLDAGKRGTKWTHLETEAVARAIGQPRPRIEAALEYLAGLGDLHLEASGLRHGYRRAREPERGGLVDELFAAFAEREQRDLERLAGVVRFAEGRTSDAQQADACLWRELLEYFGEALEQGCGHCGRCLGVPGEPLPAGPPARVGSAGEELLRELIDEGRPALRHPRQLTRFLCGLSSPALIKERLIRDGRYGRLKPVPFAEVLAAAEAGLEQALAQ